MTKNVINFKNPTLTRAILNIKPNDDSSRLETQVFEELSTQSERKYIKTFAKRNSNGLLQDKKISGNIGNLKELAKSQYLFLRNYSNRDFLVSIIPHAKRLQQVTNRNIRFRIHKLRHQYQSQLQHEGFLSFLLGKIFENLKLNLEQSKLAKRFAISNIFYCPSSINKKLYRNNFLEKDARLAGEKATLEFEQESKELARLFPKSGRLFYFERDKNFKAIIQKILSSHNKSIFIHKGQNFNLKDLSNQK